jgi:hypothetical protein
MTIENVNNVKKIQLQWGTLLNLTALLSSGVILWEEGSWSAISAKN